jgi:curved DNA-binding protein CbpA
MTDPYQTLGVNRSVSDAELRAAYRRLVQLHHPDHNGGSAESAGRFEEVQEAYAQVLRQRKAHAQPPPPRPRATAPPDPDLDARMANLERELREARAARERAQAARERARRAAREAAAAQRPSDEELGYVETDDSFSKILADARDELTGRFSEVREPATKRVADLIDELAAKLTGGRK